LNRPTKTFENLGFVPSVDFASEGLDPDGWMIMLINAKNYGHRI
jgi:hypothetical protein